MIPPSSPSKLPDGLRPADSLIVERPGRISICTAWRPREGRPYCCVTNAARERRVADHAQTLRQKPRLRGRPPPRSAADAPNRSPSTTCGRGLPGGARTPSSASCGHRVEIQQHRLAEGALRLGHSTRQAPRDRGCQTCAIRASGLGAADLAAVDGAAIGDDPRGSPPTPTRCAGVCHHAHQPPPPRRDRVLRGCGSDRARRADIPPRSGEGGGAPSPGAPATSMS